MKAKNRAVGVDNTCDFSRLLFLDFDVKQPTSELLLQILETHGHYLLFKTKHGYHIVTLDPLFIENWETELKSFRNAIDRSFVRYSLKRGCSVGRISPKFSVKNNTISSPPPQLIQVKELDKLYLISKQHYYLFKLLYNVNLNNAEPLNFGNIVLHFYITGSE